MKTKKIFSWIALFMMVVVNFSFVTPALAENCVDKDGDGYVVLEGGFSDADTGLEFEDTGNYSEEEYSMFFDAYADSDGACAGVSFKKGIEPSRCDAVRVTAEEHPDVIAEGNIMGKKVHPGAIDGPDDGIDQDCDGVDGKFVSGGDDTFDLGDMFTNIINILGYYVVGGVSGIVLLWGGITYASAAGDDTKTTKAVKAIKGAIIGLIIGVAAPSILNFVVEKMF